MNYDVRHIAEIVGGQLNEYGDEAHRQIRQISFDSRKISRAKEAIFICIEGKRIDGHDFIRAAHDFGVRNFFVSRAVDERNFEQSNFIYVEDALDALHLWAAYHRKQFEIEVIAITGSNGKTTVKEWLFQLLTPDFNVVKSPKSYNSQLGVPLSVLQMTKDHELAIFEAGISRAGEMENLAKIIVPTKGILTHLGPAHDEGFSSQTKKIKEKALLFKTCSHLIGGRRWVSKAIDLGELGQVKPFSWCESEDCMIHVKSLLSSGAGTNVHFSYLGENEEMYIPFTQRSHISNALHCMAMLLVLKIDLKVIEKRIALLDQIPMRLELKSGMNGSVIINDSYNNDVHALQVALEAAAQQKDFEKRSLFLSDILESKEQPSVLYKRVADLIADVGFDRVFTVGENIELLASLLPKSTVRHFQKTEQLLKYLENTSFNHEVVLIKGARPFRFERIANTLQRQKNQSILEVDLEAMEHNFSVYRERINPDVRIMAMVKAFAYGTGHEAIRWMDSKGMDYFCVAYPDEGLAVRNLGITTPVMVMNCTSDAFDLLVKYDLEPEIYSRTLLEELVHYLTENKTKMSIHLKVDTGMKRLGFELDELMSVQSLLSNENIRIKSVFTHLAASDSPKEADFTLHQVEVFEKAYKTVVSRINYKPLKHVLNSSGITNYPQFQMDLVRLGIGIYGIDPTGNIKGGLKPVLTFKGKISQIKQLKPGETLGYGRYGRLKDGGVVGTVSVGYADGLPRNAGRGNYSLWIKGEKARILGQVCMDMCMVNVTHIADVHVGDEVEIFGLNNPVEALAEATGTIPYELYSRIPERVKRVYHYG